MRIRPLTFAFALLPLASLPCRAGPCTRQIHAAQIRIDAKLNQRAAAGPAGVEGGAALLDHQPTPASMAAAEMTLGDVSATAVKAVGDAMTRARQADRAGNRRGCALALAEAQRATGD